MTKTGTKTVCVEQSTCEDTECGCKEIKEQVEKLLPFIEFLSESSVVMGAAICAEATSLIVATLRLDDKSRTQFFEFFRDRTNEIQAEMMAQEKHEKHEKALGKGVVH
jgi:DNA repair photolyase